MMNLFYALCLQYLNCFRDCGYLCNNNSFYEFVGDQDLPRGHNPAHLEAPLAPK